MKKDIRNKRWLYIAVVVLFVFLIGFDIVKFRMKRKRDITTQEVVISTVEEINKETIPEESIEVKEGKDDDYQYQENIETETQEELVIEYEEFYEEFDTREK